MPPESLTLKDGRQVLIRSLRAGDGVLLQTYIRALGASTDFILTFAGDVPELSSMEDRAKKAGLGEQYSMCAIDEGSGAIIACTSLVFQSRVKLAHAATLGTGVLPEWQGAGLGSSMLKRCIGDMRADPRIERIELSVVRGNDLAHGMYLRAGFVDEGCKVRSMRQPDGSYCDEIMMGLWVGPSRNE